MTGVWQGWRLRWAIGRALRGTSVRLGPALHLGAQSAVFAGVMGDRAVAVKLALGPGAADRIAALTGELAHKHPRLSGTPFHVPEPVLSLPDKGIAVMERAPDDSLARALARDEAPRAALLRQAGAWLAAYTRGERVSDDFGGGFWVRQRMTEARALPDGPARHMALALVEDMRRERARIANRPITRVRSHGDFRPATIRRDAAGDAWGVGLDGDQWIAAMRDYARFLVDLYVTLPAPGGRGDAPFGGDDVLALTGGGIVHLGEVETMLRFFAAAELIRRLAEPLTPAETDRALDLGRRINAIDSPGP